MLQMFLLLLVLQGAIEGKKKLILSNGDHIATQNEGINWKCSISGEKHWRLFLMVTDSSISNIHVTTNTTWILLTLKNEEKRYNFVCMDRTSPFNVSKTLLGDKDINSQVSVKRSSFYERGIRCRFQLLHPISIFRTGNETMIGISLKNRDSGKSHWYMETKWYSMHSCQKKTNKYTKDKRRVSVVRYPNIHVLSSPNNKIKEGARMNLTCNGYSGNRSILWFKNSQRLHSTARILEFSVVNRTLSGIYSCATKVGNVTIRSTKFHLKVIYLDNPLVSVIPSVPLSEGDVITFTCHGSSYPSPVYAWIKDGSVIAHSKELIIASITSDDEGLYQCKITNMYSSKLSAVFHFELKQSEISPFTVANDRPPINSTETEDKSLILLKNTVLFKSTGLGLKKSSVSEKGALVLLIVLVVEFLGLAAFIPLLIMIHKADATKNKGNTYEPLNDEDEEMTSKTELASPNHEEDLEIFYVLRSNSRVPDKII